MKLTVIYSIYNRTTLLKRALQSVLTQDFPKDEFCILIVDDNSTESILDAIKPYLGLLNIRYIKYDRTKHPIWQSMNPDSSLPESWYHTQAISANIGISLSESEVTCISQPEVLHSPTSFRIGYERASRGKQIFSEMHWGTQRFNQFLTTNEYWYKLPYDELLKEAKLNGAEYEPNHLPDQGHYEMYWYTEFFPTLLAQQIRGVDLLYQQGVYAEDDQFRARMRMAGADDQWGGRPLLQGATDGYCVGIHQSHTDEGLKDKKQDRESQFWNDGAVHNRELWRQFCQERQYTVANEDYDWTCQDLITLDQTFGLSNE